MRRRPSGSASDEDHDALPTTSSAHGDKGNAQQREVEQTRLDPEHARDRPKDVDGPANAHLYASAIAATAATPAPSSRTKQEHRTMNPLAKDMAPDTMVEGHGRRRSRLQNPWSCSLYTLATTLVAFAVLGLMLRSFMGRQLDSKGCEMSYMRPSFAQFSDFDTEHTRFASKYSLYLYREGGIDEDIRVKGVPILFIPGNAGSYKQVRPLAAEAAYHYHNVLRHDVGASRAGKRPLDFFSVDFNEDITAFHGQTLLDQAEYLNDAVSFILSLYHTPARSVRDSDLPDPTSVIVVGHSMGGIVARTMLVMPNYQSNSINTIITLSAPHASTSVSSSH